MNSDPRLLARKSRPKILLQLPVLVRPLLGNSNLAFFVDYGFPSLDLSADEHAAEPFVQ